MAARRRYEQRSRRPSGKQRSRGPRRNADLDVEPVAVDVCGRRMFVVGYRPAGVRRVLDAHRLPRGARLDRGGGHDRRSHLVVTALVNLPAARQAGRGHVRPAELPVDLERLLPRPCPGLRSRPPADHARPRRVLRPLPGAGQPALRRRGSRFLPIIVLSFVFQRQFIRGILSGSVKAQSRPKRRALAVAWRRVNYASAGGLGRVPVR